MSLRKSPATRRSINYHAGRVGRKSAPRSPSHQRSCRPRRKEPRWRVRTAAPHPGWQAAGGPDEADARLSRVSPLLTGLPAGTFKCEGWGSGAANRDPTPRTPTPRAAGEHEPGDRRRRRRREALEEGASRACAAPRDPRAFHDDQDGAGQGDRAEAGLSGHRVSTGSVLTMP